MEQIIATLAEIPTVKGELTVEPGLVPSGKLVITENGNYKVSQYAEVQVEMLQPSGGISISENGSYDVTNYEMANVAVPQPSGSVTITENGEHDVTDYVTADVQVPQPSGSIEISENGAFDVTEFVQAVVNVQGTGWNLLYEEEFEGVNVTSTSINDFAERVIDGIYDNKSLYCITFRRQEGKDTGYFYGSDTFIIPKYCPPFTGDNNTFLLALYSKQSSNTLMEIRVNTMGYGLYAARIQSDNTLVIKSRYNNSITRAISGTYVMKVYSLTWADGLIPTVV